eukprot:5478493-Pleurochrysis_carterae.AAC.1
MHNVKCNERVSIDHTVHYMSVSAQSSADNGVVTHIYYPVFTLAASKLAALELEKYPRARASMNHDHFPQEFNITYVN